MLPSSLFQLTSCAVLGRPSHGLIRLAEIHKRLGIRPVLLDQWFEALLQTVARNDPDFDDATRLAWCWTIAPGIFFVKSFLEGNADRHGDPAAALPPYWQSGAYDPSGPRDSR